MRTGNDLGVDWALVLAAVERLDENDRTVGLSPYTGALLRVGKVGEEAGEALQALITGLGQNPAKTQTDSAASKAAVERELFDVALAAIVATSVCEARRGRYNPLADVRELTVDGELEDEVVLLLAAAGDCGEEFIFGSDASLLAARLVNVAGRALSIASRSELEEWGVGFAEHAAVKLGRLLGSGRRSDRSG